MKHQKSIAVLPLNNLNKQAEWDFLAEGFSEQFIHAFSKIQGLRVISRNASFPLKYKELSIGEIGALLDVEVVLDGSISVINKELRLTIQLSYAKEEITFWSMTFDREISNVFRLQDEISLIIAEKLREELGHFEMSDHLLDAYELSFTVYKNYLKGRYFLMKLDYDNSLKAIGILNEVIKEAPDFPLAYLDIHQAYTYLGTMGQMSAMEAGQLAYPYLEQALRIDAELPQCLLNLSWQAFWMEWDILKGYQLIKTAIQKRPEDNMYITLANFYTVAGQFKEAQYYLDEAIKLAPASAVNTNYQGFLYYLQGKWDQALVYYKRALQIQEDLPFPISYIGWIYLKQGKYNEALEYFNQLPDQANDFLVKLGGRALSFAFLKDERSLFPLIEELQNQLNTPLAANAINYLVMIYTQLEEKEKACVLLQQALDLKLPLVLLLATEPLVQDLKGEAVFDGLKEMTQLRDNAGVNNEKLNQKFEAKQLVKYKNRLTQLMEEEQLFLKPQLTLRELAEYVNLHPNQLSLLLNEGFEQSFSEYVNSYRLLSFKEKVKEESNSHLTLLGLAYDCGFNSKTVFNTFFKKKEGLTPKQYWKKYIAH